MSTRPAGGCRSTDSACGAPPPRPAPTVPAALPPVQPVIPSPSKQVPVVAPAKDSPEAASNDQEAARLYKFGAQRGDAAAQNNLGRFYEAGRGGLPKNDQEAAHLL